MADLPETLGRAVRRRRLDLGLSMEELAARCRLAPITVSRVELGNADPTLAELQALAQALGTTLSALFRHAERLNDGS